MSGLSMLEGEIAALQAQQAAVPSTFTGAAPFGVTYKGGVPGAQLATGLAVSAGPPTMTTAQLVQRLQALLLAAQTLPQ